MSTKPIASLSLDLDNKWSYLKTHGDPGWETLPSYLDLVVPRFLEVFQQHGLTATVFVVGQDAAQEKNRDALASISAAGHEIGNHSFHHEPWLHLYSDEQIQYELATTEEHLERVTGMRPVGFRGPGYSFSESLLRILAARGYQYDASTFPSFLGPLARAYYFLTARLSAEEKTARRKLFGSWCEGFRPLRPYRWKFAEGTLIEIPVTTMPLLKVPVHVSYLLYLVQISPRIAHAYFHAALMLCRLTGVAPSLLLHPLDFLGGDDESDLAFFPAMGMPGRQKVEFVSDVIGRFCRDYRVGTMRAHAEAARRTLAADAAQGELVHG